MTTEEQSITPSEPRLISRECGGWLALSAPEDAVHIGVTGPTEDEARQAFNSEAAAWAKLAEAAAGRVG